MCLELTEGGLRIEHLAKNWAESGGNLSAAARMVGIDRKHLRGLLRRHGIL